MSKIKAIIMGAAGRDFHNFNVFFRNNPNYRVVAFTGYQIPNITERKYPPELSGKLYPQGIPIYPEEDLTWLIKKNNIDQVFFSYSDVAHEYVMHRVSIVNATGAAFVLLGSRQTMLKSKKPVISVCAVRTGSGKSQTSRKIFRYLKKRGIKVAAVRHPMPYGDLAKQAIQRFENYNDFTKYNCTVEEREEYEPYIEQGLTVFAGVDYGKILQKAEKEADVILWDGGNNDTPFFVSNLHIVVVDPLRAGHEIKYYPGETNFLTADVLVINKVNSAKPKDLQKVLANIRKYNPQAKVIKSNSVINAQNPRNIRGKKVLVIEDGPTVTHGGMAYGAGFVAAEKYSAKAIIDPRPFAAGFIKETFEKFPHLKKVLPAMGYGKSQIIELEQTINKADCEVVVIGTPIDLTRLLQVNKPTVRVTYDIEEVGLPTFSTVLDSFIKLTFYNKNTGC